MNPPTRRTALAAVAAFSASLVVAFFVGGAGSASAPASSPGVRAVRLDVAAPTAGVPAIGKAASLPALARPKPKPKPAPPAPPPARQPSPTVPTPAPVPTTPVPVAPSPAPAPAPRPAPPPPPPSIQFDDSG